MTGFAWICACGTGSLRAFAHQGRARRNGARHSKVCPRGSDAFNVLDIGDEQQKALWLGARRVGLQRAANGAIAHGVRDLWPGSPKAKDLGCPCPGGLSAGDVVSLLVKSACPVHGAWARAVGSTAP